MEEEKIEVWREVKGWEGRYEVSNWGRVRSFFDTHGNRRAEPRILKPRKNGDGYLRVILRKDGKGIYKSVHRLVAEAFLPNPLNLPQINHRNEIKDDNRLENLEWCDAKYNNNYGSRNEKAVKSLKGKFVNSPNLSKRVLQYTLDGNLIREWPSLREVERQTGWNSGNISMACNGKWKTAYGHVWRYTS